jgi:hypothetical protein
VGRFVSGIGVRILIVLVIAGGAFVLRDRLSGSAGELQVGDCFDRATTETVDDVQHHPCTESHNAEVVLVAAHPAAKGAAYLTDTDLNDYIETTCATAVSTYVGPSVSLDTLNWGLIYPAEGDWATGERKMTCYVMMLDGTSLTRSLKAK